MHAIHRFGVLLLLAAAVPCALALRPASSHAVIATDIAAADCLAPEHDSAECPTFLIDALNDARQLCSEGGGRIAASHEPSIWAIDVDGDGAAEYILDNQTLARCEGAWSIFGCGSLGCPKTLHQKRDGAWQAVGQFWADAPESVHVLETPADGNRDLRIGCAYEDPCPEYWYAQWTNGHYERTYLEVRGRRVEFADSIHGLYGLTREIDVLDAPARDATVIGHYGPETEVEIVGTAAGADYYYVSPCNACASGFVPKSAVRLLQ